MGYCGIPHIERILPFKVSFEQGRQSGTLCFWWVSVLRNFRLAYCIGLAEGRRYSYRGFKAWGVVLSDSFSCWGVPDMLRPHGSLGISPAFLISFLIEELQTCLSLMVGERLLLPPQRWESGGPCCVWVSGGLSRHKSASHSIQQLLEIRTSSDWHHLPRAVSKLA